MIHMPNPVHQAEGIYKRGQKLTNVIKKFWSMPCAGNGLIYFEAAALGIWDFVWAIESPDIRHMITKGTGRSALCHIKTVINDAGIARGPRTYPVKSALYHMAAKIDISTWWGFLAAAAEDGLYDFFSSAIRLSGCQKMPKGGEWGYGDHCIAGGPHNGNWNPGPVWRAPDWPTTPQAPNWFWLDPGETAVLSGSYSIWNSTGIQPLSFQTRIRSERTGYAHQFAEPDGNPIEGFSQAFGHEITNPNSEGSGYALETYVDPAQPYYTWLSNGIGHGFYTKHPAGWVDKGDRNSEHYKHQNIKLEF